MHNFYFQVGFYSLFTLYNTLRSRGLKVMSTRKNRAHEGDTQEGRALSLLLCLFCAPFFLAYHLQACTMQAGHSYHSCSIKSNERGIGFPLHGKLIRSRWLASCNCDTHLKEKMIMKTRTDLVSRFPDSEQIKFTFHKTSLCHSRE